MITDQRIHAAVDGDLGGFSFFGTFTWCYAAVISVLHISNAKSYRKKYTALLQGRLVGGLSRLSSPDS